MLHILNLGNQSVEKRAGLSRVLNIFQLPAMIGCLMNPSGSAANGRQQRDVRVVRGIGGGMFVIEIISRQCLDPRELLSGQEFHDAPPPVEMCVIFDSIPDWAIGSGRIAAATMAECLRAGVSARAMAKVPSRTLDSRNSHRAGSTQSSLPGG